MSKSIERCYECNEDYCESCVYGGNCQQCGVNTCGESECIDDCDIKNGCGDKICTSCKDTHNCAPDEDEEDSE